MRAPGGSDTLIRAYLEQGGQIEKIPEGKVTIDWEFNAPVHHVARAMSKLGHQRRYQKKAPRE